MPVTFLTNEDFDAVFTTKEIRGANRFDVNAVTTGYYVNPNNGDLAINNYYTASDFIQVVPGEIITYQYGTLTVYQGRTIGTISFLAAYDENKNYISGGRNLTSYEVPEGVSFIRLSTTGLASASNVAVVASAEKMDYVPYERRTVRVLSSESHDDAHIAKVAKDSVGEVGSSGECAPPIIAEKSGKLIEIVSPFDGNVRHASSANGAEDVIRLWGKNCLNLENDFTVTSNGVTVTWDATKQEMMFNGTTIASGDWKLVNPLNMDWIVGEEYTFSVKRVSGTATIGPGTASTTYAWGIFQDNAAKYVRGATYMNTFPELYSFAAKPFALDAGRKYILYFQCWRPGTVFDNYRVKLQIEKGSAATEWEAYQSQTATAAEAESLTLAEGQNFAKSESGAEITIGYMEDTKTYVDEKTVGNGVDSFPDAVITNAYDKDNTGVEAGKFVWNGTTTDNSAYFATGFIAVEPNTDYAFFGSDSTPTVRSVCEYDKNRNFISNKSHGNVTTIRTTANTRYLRISGYNGAEQSLTVRKGTLATGYTPCNVYKIPGEAVSQDAGAVDAYLPKHIYCAVGRTIELYNNQVCLQADKYHMKWHCSVGKALKRKFSITGTEALIGDHTLKLGVYNDRLEEVWSGMTTLHIVSSTVSQHSICPIGDSLTNSKAWLAEVVNLSGGTLSFVGSYNWNLKDAGDTQRSGGHEGRSGFTAAAYLNGSTYSFGGESSPNVFWNGTKFSWSDYKTKTGFNPDAVQIFLGTNGISNDNTDNANHIRQLVDAIREDDATIPIFVCNTIYRSNQNGIGVQTSNDGYASAVGVWKYNEDKKVMDLMKRLDALLETYDNVHMINLALSHDSEYNFGLIETSVNPRIDVIKERMPVESVHPTTAGYYQMADVMFSVICGAYS